MSKKPGTEFFKKMAEKGSMFDGMQFKGPKANKETAKPTVAQSQTSLNFTEVKKEEQKTVTKDDLSTSSPLRQTPPESSFKKSSIKPSESSVLTPTPTQDKEKTPSKPAQEPVDEKEVKKVEQVSKSQVFSKLEKKLEKRPSEASETGPESVDSQRKASQTSSRRVSEESPRESKKAPARKPDVRKGSVAEKAPAQPKKSERETVLEEINQYTGKIVGVVLHQKEIRQTIAENRKSLEEERDRINQLTTRQSVCAEEEEYEEADKLQTLIEEAEKKVEETQLQNSYLQQQLIVHEKEELSLMNKQQTQVKKMGRKLKLIELQLQDDAAIVKRDELEQIEHQKNQQELERKKIQRLEKDIAHQTQQLEEVDEVFQEERKSKLLPLVEQKQQAEEDKTELQAEVKALEQRLKEKKAELAEKSKSVRSLTQSIKETEESFKEEEQGLAKRKEHLGRLEEERSELEGGVQKMSKIVEEQTASMEKKVNQKLKEAKQLSDIAKDFEERQGGFEQEMQARKVALDSFVQCASLVKEFQEKHNGEKERAKDLEYKKNNVTAEIGRLEQKREGLKGQIPGIQVEQKKFAEMKNFKAAGLKKAEIKEIQEELDRIKKRIEGCVGQEYEYSMGLEELKQAQKQIIEEEQLLQKDLAHSQYVFNKSKLNDIRVYLKELGKASTLPNRDKMVKEITNEVTRIEAELVQLNEHYELGFKLSGEDSDEERQSTEQQPGEQPAETNEESNTSEGAGEAEEEPIEDNNDNKYEAPVLDEQASGEAGDDSGYVPLSLD